MFGEQSMSTLRKSRESAAGGSPPPEAYNYDDDVTAEAVKVMTDRAKPFLEKDEYVIIDGYVGNK
jgi:hypothetical protein